MSNVDDCLPRAQLKTQYALKEIHVDNLDQNPEVFFKEDYVRVYLNHLLCLESSKDICKPAENRQG